MMSGMEMWWTGVVVMMGGVDSMAGVVMSIQLCIVYRCGRWVWSMVVVFGMVVVDRCGGDDSGGRCGVEYICNCELFTYVVVRFVCVVVVLWCWWWWWARWGQVRRWAGLSGHHYR